ncbi:MAG: glutathione S-transferase N-terminal domain-containing protein [Deltaproteobacteria bacterium]|nr:glutathione S-transferase N-terminal domain-containing protein [Deltaproteobacteria bacterium]
MSPHDDFVLYGIGLNDRSGKLRWLAHELALPLEERRIRPPEHRQPPYRELNPYGMVPTVIWRGRTHVESTATLQLVEKDAVWGYLAPLTERPAAQAAGFFGALGLS